MSLSYQRHLCQFCNKTANKNVLKKKEKMIKFRNLKVKILKGVKIKTAFLDLLLLIAACLTQKASLVTP